MKSSQYSAIREAGIDEFAVYPVDVESKLPWPIENANRTGSVRACPTGLLQATIVQDNVTWSEAFTLGCGDTEYQRKRRNGVLVEIALETFQNGKAKPTIRTIQKQVRTKIVKRDDGRAVQMIVSKAAIMAPWNEYALIEAERAKSRAEEQERETRLNAATSAVGGESGRFTEISRKYSEAKREYVPPPGALYDYVTTLEWRGDDRLAYLKGEVILSLERAEEIAALLNKKTGVKP
jgi:hypothetical protein